MSPLNPLDEAIDQLPPPPAGTLPARDAPDVLAAEYDAIAQRRLAMQTGRLQGAATEAADLTPERAVEIRRLSGLLHLPPDVVQRNFDDVKRRAPIDTPFSRMIREAPALADWAADPINAAAAQDDLPRLSALERTVRIGGHSLRRLATGWPAIGGGVWGVMRAGAEWAGADAVAELAAGAQGIAEHLRTRLAGSAPPGAGPIEHALYAGVESLSLSLAALPAAALGPGAYVGVLGAVQAGQSYGEARTQGLAVGQATSFAAAQGGIEILTELVPARFLIADLAAKAPLWRAVQHQLKTELLGEEVATAVQDLNEWANLPANAAKPFLAYSRSVRVAPRRLRLRHSWRPAARAR